MRGWVATALVLLLIGLWVAMQWPSPAIPGPAPVGPGLDADASPYATARAAAAPADRGEATSTVAREGVASEATFSLRVQAVDAFGAPVPAATITLRATGEAEPFARHEADANGGWSGRVTGARIVVSAAADWVGRSVAYEVTPARAELGPVELLLGRPVLVTGLVVDDAGRGIAEDRVEVVCTADRRQGQGIWHSHPEVHTDAAGRFAFEAMAGVRLQLRRRVARDDMVWISAADGAHAVLAPFGTFRLYVRALAPSGDPVAAQLEEKEFLIPGIRCMDEESPRMAQTEQLAVGEFRLLLPGPGPCGRWLHAPGFATTRIEMPAMVWPRTVHRVDVTMTPLVTTRLQVDRCGLPWPADPTGMGFDCAVVRLRPVSRHLPGSACTPLAGRPVCVAGDDPVEVDLPAGTEWFACVGDGPEVRGRAGDREVILRPSRCLELPRIQLEVYLQGGGRVTGPSLRCLDDEPVGLNEGLRRDFVELAADGAPVQLGTLFGGRGTIVVTDPASRQTTAVEIRSDRIENLRVILQPPAELIVHVRCGPRPARGVEVVLASFDEQRTERVDTDGRAVLHVTPGTARLQVRRGNEVLVDRELMLSPGRLELELPVAL